MDKRPGLEERYGDNQIVRGRFRDEIRPATPIYSLVPMYGSDLARVQAKSTEGSDFTLYS